MKKNSKKTRGKNGVEPISVSAYQKNDATGLVKCVFKMHAQSFNGAGGRCDGDIWETLFNILYMLLSKLKRKRIKTHG